jgi:hypothetical protein
VRDKSRIAPNLCDCNCNQIRCKQRKLRPTARKIRRYKLCFVPNFYDLLLSGKFVEYIKLWFALIFVVFEAKLSTSEF